MKKLSSKNTLFLIELILAILFFSLSSAVCSQIFVKTHLINKKSDDINSALTIVSNFTSVIKAENGDVKSAYNFLTGNDHFNTNIFFDSNLEICSKENAKYLLIINPYDEYSVNLNVISVSDNSNIISQDIYTHIKAK